METKAALEGVKVIDMSRVFAGPVSAQILGDLGADVIKVERPKVGDDGRGYGLAWVPGKDGLETHQSSFFTASNRNKRSITVNHAKPEGQDIIRELVRTADVLIENFKTGDLARYGLDHAALSASEETRRLRQCVRGLPARYREVIILCELQELDYAETALVLNVPIGTVRSRLHRGRQMLIERLRRRNRLPVGTRCAI